MASPGRSSNFTSKGAASSRCWARRRIPSEGSSPQTNSIRKDCLRPSSQETACPWKGTASYYDLEVGGKQNEGAAWYYPTPKAAAEQIKGRVAFWRGVEVFE